MNGRILVTGGSGFIGSSLVRSMSDEGYKVLSVSRFSDEAVNSFSLDLTDAYAVREFIKNSKSIDIIIHCAAIAHGEPTPKGYSISDYNSLIVRNLISSFSSKQPHWIFMSSISVYGDSYFESPVKMEHSPLPTDDYGKGKLEDEKLLLYSCEHVDILRLMPTYDFSHVNDIKKRVFIPKTPIKIRILPSPTYSFCHVNIVTKTVMKCLSQNSGRRLHQVGDPMPVLQSDLVKEFKGPSIVIPQLIFKWFLAILPSRFRLLRSARLLVKKLGMSNTYVLGVEELVETKSARKSYTMK